MRYKIRITSEAKLQLAAISDYIAVDSPASAQRWRMQIREHMRSLNVFPDRHEMAYRAHQVGRDIRHTFFGVYRILYAIEGETVIVLSVRHGARQPLTLEEVRQLG